MEMTTPMKMGPRPRAKVDMRRRGKGWWRRGKRGRGGIYYRDGMIASRARKAMMMNSALTQANSQERRCGVRGFPVSSGITECSGWATVRSWRAREALSVRRRAVTRSVQRLRMYREHVEACPIRRWRVFVQVLSAVRNMVCGQGLDRRKPGQPHIEAVTPPSIRRDIQACSCESVSI